MDTFKWKLNIVYWYKVFNLYINLKEAITLSLVMFTVVTIFAVSFQDYFLLFMIPLWVFLYLINFLVVWKYEIQPEREEVLREIKLEKKYNYLYNNFIRKS